MNQTLNEYTIKKYKRAKYVRIVVKPGGEVVVTVPWRMPKYLVERFVQSRQEWVQSAREKMRTVQPLARKGSDAEYRQHKKQAEKELSVRLAELNALYGFAYKRVSIRNQQTRWGSCSKSGTISLSYRLLFLPPEVRDYVLVHELCHLAHMNHSSRFWQLVAQTIPNYKLLREQLQRVGTRSSPEEW